MIGWPAADMAALAVGGAGNLVIEDSTSPGCGCMTRRTLPAEVIGRPAADVAALAIHCTRHLMIERRTNPGCSCMAG